MDADASFIGALATVDRNGNDATYSFDVEFWLNGIWIRRPSRSSRPPRARRAGSSCRTGNVPRCSYDAKETGSRADCARRWTPT